MWTNTQKKFLKIAFVGISIVSLISALSDSPTMPPRSLADIPDAADLIQQMPDSSDYTYGTSEFEILNEVVAKGMVLRHYQRTFASLTPGNRNGNETYQSFEKDMEQYSIYLRRSLLKLQSSSPSEKNGMQSRTYALERIERLSSCVALYKQHVFDVKDTLDYLNECIFALERVSQQTELPN